MKNDYKNYTKLNRKTEKVLAFGGVGLLQKDLLVYGVVIVAIITDFFVFYTSFSKNYDSLTAFIMALSCAVIIDTVPLVISYCIVQLRSPNLDHRVRRWNMAVLIGAAALFLVFFSVTAFVRWKDGPSMFDLDTISSRQAEDVTVTMEMLTSGQKAILILTCALPFFTSAGVLFIGLFTDQNAKRRQRLRNQRNALVAYRAQLVMQQSELDAMLHTDLEDLDEKLYHDMCGYTDALCNALRAYFRLALAEKLQTANDLSYLARQSNQLATMENQIIQLANEQLEQKIPMGATNTAPIQ